MHTYDRVLRTTISSSTYISPTYHRSPATGKRGQPSIQNSCARHPPSLLCGVISHQTFIATATTTIPRYNHQLILHPLHIYPSLPVSSAVCIVFQERRAGVLQSDQQRTNNNNQPLKSQECRPKPRTKRHRPPSTPMPRSSSPRSSKPPPRRLPSRPGAAARCPKR